jgi:hypothetical protein
MRPLNKQDYLLIGIVALTLLAGIVTLLAVALKFWAERKEGDAEALPRGPSRLGPSRRSSTPQTSTYERGRRSRATNTLPGEPL